MAMHWTEKRRARAALGRGLERLGWRLWGMHEDRSDLMTDYYEPESWDGVATLDHDREQLIACVDVGSYLVEYHSGQAPKIQEHIDAGPCPRCAGTGSDPEVPFTLASARENPAAFHDAWQAVNCPGAVNLFRSVVSPILFNADGSVKCRNCKGTAKHYEVRERDGERWPTFHETPKGSTWHVERGGKIVAKGTGLRQVLVSDAATDELAARIHTAATVAGDLERGAGVTVRENPTRNGVEIRFAGRPPDTVRLRLKAAGWRWSRRHSLWYNRATPEARAFAAALVQGTLA